MRYEPIPVGKWGPPIPRWKVILRDVFIVLGMLVLSGIVLALLGMLLMWILL